MDKERKPMHKKKKRLHLNLYTQLGQLSWPTRFSTNMLYILKICLLLNPKPMPSKTPNLGLLSRLNTNTHTSPLGSQPQKNNNNPLSSTPKTTLSHSISTKIKISSPTLPYPHNYKILILWGLKEVVIDTQSYL